MMFFKNIPAIAVILIDKDVLKLEPRSLEDADLLELRVDMFEDLSRTEEIFLIAKKKFRLPLLCTVRSPKEGGKKEIKNRLEIYKRVLSYCELFDIEIFSEEAEKLREITKNRGIKLIASYHRFDITPSVEELDRIFKEGKKLNADIIKIATMVNVREDLEKLLIFTLKYKEENIIVVGMGEKGIPSRIINPLFGSLITYAALNTISAPGQIYLQDIVNIFKIFGLRK
ncbi:MAG: type I 3-dehydroquinate dehydratase [Thermodesulfovibrio sp.]|nr:type I 3-dehydroquinate dehydratase [Thermodesulfovibrio sp.]